MESKDVIIRLTYYLRNCQLIKSYLQTKLYILKFKKNILSLRKTRSISLKPIMSKIAEDYILYAESLLNLLYLTPINL